MRSPAQIEQFKLAKMKRYKKKEDVPIIKCIFIDPLRYCFAVLSEGMGETQARRFLAKINIVPPSITEFYNAQKKVDEIIVDYTQKMLNFIKSLLSSNTIFGLDCSWSSRRNATHAIVVFMDVQSKLIFDYVIVSRNAKVSDIEFYESSNMMENAAVKYKSKQFVNNYKFVGFIHDFDLDTAPAFQPDSETGNLIEYLDPGHLKKVVENKFDSFNGENHLYQLKDHIIKRFSTIVRNKEISIEKKVELWYQTPQFIIENCDSKGYLVNSRNKKRRVSPETAKNTLQSFLTETEWIIRKCSFSDTQAIESFNPIKARMCPKYLPFQTSFRTRCLMSILQWNEKDWYLQIDAILTKNRLDENCSKIIKQDIEKKRQLRQKSKQVNIKILRNIKRRNARLKNKIKLEGHLYADDVQKGKVAKRYDPLREVALIPLPNISNYLTSNCFINSFLQLFKHTNIQNNFCIKSDNQIYSLMMKLNNKENLNEQIINESRKKWSPPFSISAQEDCAEFIEYVMNNTYHQKIDKFEYRYFNFSDAYQYSIKTSYICAQCKKINDVIENNFILTIPSTSYSFMTNFEQIFKGKIERRCECKCNKCRFIKKIIKSPEYLIIQIMRFKYKKALNSIVKDYKIIDLPEKLNSQYLNDSYEIFGVIYHIGETSQFGHYLAKRITSGGVETYDDSRCYMNPSEKVLTTNNSYIIVYKKTQKSNSIDGNLRKILQMNFTEKVQHLFFLYSDLLSLHIYDVMKSASNQEDLAKIFKYLCLDLVSFNAQWSNRLYEFMTDFIKYQILPNPHYFVIRYLIIAGQKSDIQINYQNNLFLLFNKCFENNIITSGELEIINREISVLSESQNHFCQVIESWINSRNMNL